ncbi:hypothetical protein FFI89_018720 [Bradyrhizobium sp. KBS0727]|uniref:glycoside hydrolase family 25 protein n=1 Tax=unclassified Bradyrhizobium TaxID=2631580 RepID=UPI00110DB7B9|nr:MULTISPECIES: glycoside hydrolase family 25 protein [unclassified Bradyrhizobium]QDW38999.1 hypothetical protein FFI71_018720 [Bradyrhizobium sp. KBS0725]QDW45602.1 hypothetical protein FFI89_018720 [Bradyrhizobium sp. KBS0727]
MAMTPRVIDISHHNTVKDFRATANAGVWGVIHKSSQGPGYRDPDYAARRRQALAAGMLWGAYHFNDGSDVAAQVDWFIKCAAPDSSTLMVLDFEDNPKSNMTAKQAVAFLRLLEQKLGRKGAIYSGNRLKETIGTLNAADRKYLLSHRLWLCQYGPRAVLPTGFAKYWLWQYTGDGVGQPPHNVPGVVAGNRGLDLNVYDRDRASLAAEWAGAGSAIASIMSVVAGDDGASSHASQAAADQADDAADDAGDAATSATEDAPTPAADDVAAEADLYAVKRRLKAMNYNPGVLNAEWGGMTAGAIAGFINDRGGSIAPPASFAAFIEVKDDLRSELARAEDEVPPFVRPVSEARASGDASTVATVAPEAVPAKRSFLKAAWAAVATFFTAVWTALSDKISAAWDFFTDHKDDLGDSSSWLSTVGGYLAEVPVSLWILLGAAGLAWIAYDARDSVNKITEQVKTGARQ